MSEEVGVKSEEKVKEVKEEDVFIIIQGHGNFCCTTRWTVERAENRIRSTYGLIYGGIEKNKRAMFPEDTFTSDSTYHFVNFRDAQDPQQLQGSIAFTLNKIAIKVDNMHSAVVPQENYRSGSSVVSEDFNDTFAFVCTSASIEKNELFYSWRREEFNSFKTTVKSILLRKIGTLIEFANSADKHEESSLRPQLLDVLTQLVPHAFGAIADDEVRVGRFEYNDARIKDVKKGKMHVFNGITDLSCLLAPENIAICGFENKISKKSLLLRTGKAIDVNRDGKNAMSQTATQILGAVNRLQSLGVPVPVFTQIGTNGWQYLLVRRVQRHRRRATFLAFVPVSLGVISQNGKVLAKPAGDPSYDLVAHMISMMFDNARYLVMSIKHLATVSFGLDLLNLDGKLDEEDYDDDNDDSQFDRSFKYEPPPPSTSKPSRGQSKHQGGGNLKNDTSGKEKRTPLGELNSNMIIHPLTTSALRFHNSIM